MLALPVLRELQDRRRIGRLRRKQQVQEDPRVLVPASGPRDRVQPDPDENDPGLYPDEPPRAEVARDRLRGPLTRSRLIVDGLVRRVVVHRQCSRIVMTASANAATAAIPAHMRAIRS